MILLDTYLSNLELSYTIASRHKFQNLTYHLNKGLVADLVADFKVKSFMYFSVIFYENSRLSGCGKMLQLPLRFVNTVENLSRAYIQS